MSSFLDRTDRWLGWVWLACLVAPIAQTLTTTVLPSFRAWQYMAVAATLVAWRRRRERTPIWSTPLQERSILAGALAAFVASALSRYAAVRLDAIDFSIFDWMLAASAEGRIFWSPFHGFNHLTIHQSWIMILPVGLKAVLAHPAWLQLLHALLLWLPVFPLRGLMRRLDVGEALASLIVVAYLTWPFTGSVLNGGFRLESFYPLAIFSLLWAWVARSRWLAVALVAFLSVKEDAALYALGLGAFAATLVPERRRDGVLVATAAIATFVCNALVARHFARDAGLSPTFLGFWAKYGASMPEVALGILRHPFEALGDMARSGFWQLYGPLALLPLASLEVVAFSLPGIVLLGTAVGSTGMHGYGGYYPLVLACIALYGLACAGVRYGARMGRIACFAALLAPLFGAGWYETWPVDREAMRELAAVEPVLAQAPGSKSCVQSTAVPHLPMSPKLALLTDACLASADGYVVLLRGKGAYPLKRRAVDDLLQLAAGKAVREGRVVSVVRAADLRP